VTAPAVTPAARQAQDYLAAVEHELADLPAEDRSALLEDLGLHLEALAAEQDERDIAVRLGAPSAYAADLRSAAGLPARAELTPAGNWRERLDGALATPLARRAGTAARGVLRLLGDLRPAWWVLRGYLLVAVPCLLHEDRVRDVPVPAPLGSHLLGGVLVVVAVTGSVLLGRRSLPRAARALVVACGVVLVLVSAVVAQGEWSDVVERGPGIAAPLPEVPSETYPLLSRSGPVTDVFPFAADGTPLEGVLLYDQDGRPLKVGFQQWWADQCARVLEQPEAADGVAVPNSYPQAYVLDPAGVDLSRSIARSADSCEAELSRPDVPLPTFAAPTSTAPDAGD
jgi:hypothetical protein